MKKLNQAGISHYILPVIVVLLITAVGAKVLTSSHADSITPTALSTAATASALDQKRVTIQNASTSITPSNASLNIGVTIVPSLVNGLAYNTQVNKVAPDGSLFYSTSGYTVDNNGANNIQDCYTLAVASSAGSTATSAKVQIASYNNVKTIKVPAVDFGTYGPDNYAWYCVAANPGQPLPFHDTTPAVKNLSPDLNVYVYQQILFSK